MQKNRFSVFIVCIILAVTEGLPQVNNQVPIAPNSIPQFVDRLPHFAGGRIDATGGASLTITTRPTSQVALSTGTVVNAGTVGVTAGAGEGHYWAYEVSDGTNTYGPLWPSYTIEAKRGVPLNVTYVNGLTGETYDKVGLKVDQTLHWANPNNLEMMDPLRFQPYGGEPPIVTHLHGGEVASESDGGPDAWFTPNKAEVGPSWNDGVDDQYYYPNTQEAATLWYHDHALGATRLNVYAGLAGFYFLRDDTEDALHLPGWSGDNAVQEVDRLTGLPVGDSYLPEIEVVIQDRMFDTDGNLYYPNLPPNPAEHPFWTPEFVGDIITVNGKTWPYLSVAQRKYRFRFLNGSNARFYELWLQDLATGAFGPVINQIGTDGGLLDAPVTIDPALGGKLILAPGERADVVIDFSNSPTGAVWTLKNSGRAPYPKGAPPNGFTVGRIMQFVVNGTGTENSQLPASLRSTALVKLTNFAGAYNVTPAVTRQLTLNEVMGMGGPLEVLVNNTKWDGNGSDPGLGITETPTEGTTEVWQIINLTADAHPIHLHLVQFQLVSRQKFNQSRYMKVYTAAPSAGPPNAYDVPNADGAVGGNPAITPYLQGAMKPANPNERGWKDTFIMYPGEVTTVIVRFAPTDLPLTTADNLLKFDFDPSEGPGYVWHCHIIDHEDNEMMRPYSVNPNPSRASAGKAGVVAVNETPAKYELEQNYPNPFNPGTVIRFSVPKDELVTLKIYDVLGREVGTLINQVIPEGNHRVNFDGTGLASGMYIYTLNAGSYTQSYKMVLAK